MIITKGHVYVFNPPPGIGLAIGHPEYLEPGVLLYCWSIGGTSPHIGYFGWSELDSNKIPAPGFSALLYETELIDLGPL